MEVAHVVASIISAFGNGKDLFRRMSGKKLKRKGREPTYSEQELWLRDSLDRRPREIRDSYSKSVARLGHKFEIGDSTAHTSLAHTLFMLNSGLINLINQALSTDLKKKDLSRRSLLNLSELAAAETLNALSQLSLRLHSRSQLHLRAPKKDSRDVKASDSNPNRKQEESSLKKRPAPAPLLVRGGWVRPKSGSVVSSSSEKSRSGGAKHVRSQSEPVVPRLSKVLVPEARPTTLPTIHARYLSSDDDRRAERQPSMLLVPSDYFGPMHKEAQSYQEPPPRPPKIPLHSRPDPNYRPRPPSQGTCMTTSTKIGEIPEPRPSRPPATLSRQVHDPRLVQYLTTLPDGLPEEEPKKRGRGFKFWKRSDRIPAVEAY